MDQHIENIWHRRSTWKIVRGARWRFKGVMKSRKLTVAGQVSAHTALASDYYSLVKRYVNWWGFPLAIIFMWRAAFHRDRAYEAVKLSYLHPNKLDVLQTIYRRLPWPWKNMVRAMECIEAGLFENHANGPGPLPHTLALLWVGLAECRIAFGAKLPMVREAYHRALSLESAIMAEQDKLMAERQLCRVLKSAGDFFARHDDWSEQHQGIRLLERALSIAERVSRDQAVAVKKELVCQKKRFGMAI